ncbi:MAG: tRNA (adenosine(37)-N6)-threonylcarbamoyltransferase complex transferase subunit TsaD [Patescibacteria group bacterium]
MIILGIESSCDETAASLIEAKGDKIKVVSNVVSSQIKIHAPYGGVIPELAARNHIKDILPVIDEALYNSAIIPSLRGGVRGGGHFFLSAQNIKMRQKIIDRVDLISITTGPGLVSSLLIGIETAKALAYAWQKPLIGINHLAGHIYGNFIGNIKKIEFPALALVVSGGHTELILMRGHFKFRLLGQTRDDAAGEAFDKAAKILNLGYPGGPAVAQRATEVTNYELKITKIRLPRPMINDDNFDFSFSGLKTSLLYQVQKDADWKNKTSAYCAEFQQAVVDVLVAKTIKAAKKYKVKTVMLAGGVAANLELREQLGRAVKTELPRIKYNIPDLKYTTDNAAMIAAAGYFLHKSTKTLKHENIKTKQLIKVDCNKKL